MFSSMVILLSVCHSVDATGLSDKAALNLIAEAFPAVQQHPQGPWNSSVENNKCLWGGVSCDPRGNVVVLYLRHLGLRGVMPDALCSLDNLSEIYFANNSLQLPSSLQNCTQVRHFEWSSNNLSVPIPDTLCQLKNATVIQVSNNRLSGTIPPCIGDLQQLDILDFRTNDVESLPPQIGSLSSLTVLRAWNNALSGSIPAEICNLQALRILDLGLNNLSGTIPPCMNSMINLTYLNLDRRNTTAAFAPPLPNLGSLTNLLFFSLADQTLLSGPFPTWIADLKSLEFLILNRTGFSGQIPEFVTDLTQLRVLNLQWSQFSGPLPSNWSAMANLIELRVGIQPISGTLPESIGDLRNIETLHAQSAQLSGIIPESFSRLTKLKNLRLHWNRLNGTIPAFLSNFGPYIEFSIHGNRFVGSLPANLTQRVSGLLSVHSNLLSGCLSENDAASLTTCDARNNRYLCGCNLTFCGLSACDPSCGPALPLREAFCRAGTWLVPASLSAVNQPDIVILRPITVLGDFIIPSEESTATINLVDLDPSRPLINITGCASFDGTLQINLGSVGDETYRANRSVWVAEFEKGLCSPQNPEDDGKFKAIVATRAGAPCRSIHVDPLYSPRSLVVMMGEPDTNCLVPPADPTMPNAPGSPSSMIPGDSAGFPIALIAGCIAAGVVVVTIAIILIVCVCKKKCIPAEQYNRHWRRSRAPASL